MNELIPKAAALRVIFDSVGKPATEIYQLVREIQPVTAEWIEASALLPPIEREERDEEERTRGRVSVPVLAIVRDGTYQVVRRIDEESAEPGGHEWHGWVREPDDGAVEDVTHWMPLPEGQEPELPRSGREA